MLRDYRLSRAGLVTIFIALAKSIRTAPADRATGIDLSKYDVWFVPPQLPPKPVHFVWQRASYGGNKDEKFEEIYAGVKLMKLTGSYHYFSTGTEWKAQADKFLSIVEGRNFSFYAIDYERAYNNLNATSYLNAYKWQDYVHTYTGKDVYLYCNKDVYENAMNPYGDWQNAVPFWYAIYYYYGNPYTMTPSLPKGRTSWDFWQYGISSKYYNTENGLEYGVSRINVDLDAASLSKDELYQKYHVDETPQPTDCQEYIDKIQQTSILLKEESERLLQASNDLASMLE